MSIKLQRQYQMVIYPSQYLQRAPISPDITNPSSISAPDLSQNFTLQAAPPAFSFTPPISSIVTITNPFTLTINIQRKALASMNTGTFQIYNLSSKTRDLLYKDYTDSLSMRRITLKAGYLSTGNLSTIFDGNIIYANSYRKQGTTNFITEIEAYDWGFPVVNATTSISFNSPATPKNQIIAQLVNDLCAIGPSGQQLSKGHIHNYVDDNGNQITEAYKTISDYSWPQLQYETGGACYIDNGQLNIIEDNEYFTGPFSQINATTGLLGSPKRSDTYVVCEILFEPSLLVGQQITLASITEPKYNGEYKVVGINHSGIISDAMGGRLMTTVSLFSFPQNQKLIALSEAGGTI